ncbi:MAG: DUF5668 domain-containing protein [Coriobacteriia bacterium]|nr:DUF5668 domain-containing protein [Coriobacteriia bacterium]
MSASNNEKTANVKQGKVSGIGTVTVDGEVVYDPSMSFASGDDAETKTAPAHPINNDSANASTGGGVKAGTGYQYAYSHNYPKNDAVDSHSAKSRINKWYLWLGVILIVLGVLLFLDLISNVIPTMSHIFGGYSFWQFWPLLIVIGGIATAFSPASDSPNPRLHGKISPSQFFGGLSTIVLGLVLLTNSLGFVYWMMWLDMLRLWPLILIVVGLSILSHALKTEWFSVFASVLSIVILTAVASSMWTAEPSTLVEPFASLGELGRLLANR